MPTGVVPAFKPIKAQSRSKDDVEGFMTDSSAAKSNYALSRLQHAVKSDVVMLSGYHMSEILHRIPGYLCEEVPGISRAKVAIYSNVVEEKIYDMIREQIETTGKAELKFGKNGPIGDLKAALDSAYEEYSKVFKAVPQVDFSDMKGFDLSENREEYESANHPTGDMTITADGKIVIKQNANSPTKTQDGGQAQ